MRHRDLPQYTAFCANRRVATGTLLKVVEKIKGRLDRKDQTSVLIFDNRTGKTIDVDHRSVIESGKHSGSLAPPAENKNPGPGRPKLGVVSREISLLPRHWEWLASQSGGASVTLRKLVEEAKKRNHRQDTIREAQEAAYRFMSVMAGDRPGFEEALRSLYQREKKPFKQLISNWPKDIRKYLQDLAEPVFE